MYNVKLTNEIKIIYKYYLLLLVIEHTVLPIIGLCIENKIKYTKSNLFIYRIKL